MNQFGTMERMFCRCGCGRTTSICTESRPERGHIKGQPYPFIRGHRIGPIPEERFWSRVDKTGDCWEWQGGRHLKGYGVVYWRGKNRKAHRVSWELAHGDVPDDLMVCHHCDNPPCVRPDHLFLGTNQDNIDDANRKGRLNGRGHPTARDMPQAVLPQTAARVSELHALGWSQYRIAGELGISRRSVQRVLDGTHWTVAA